MNTQSTVTPEQKRYCWRMRIKKLLLYLAWIASAVVVFIAAFFLFDEGCQKRVVPQIDRAILQITEMLPQMEQDEEMLRNACNEMIDSWNRVFSDPEDANSPALRDLVKVDGNLDQSFEKLINETLSWMNRVTQLKVGRDGEVGVIDKKTGRIVAYPESQYIGETYYLTADPATDESKLFIPIASVKELAESGQLSSYYHMLVPGNDPSKTLSRLDYFFSAFTRGAYGGVLAYDDYYIVCGIHAGEFIFDVFVNAFGVTFIYLILMWLFVKWICLVMDTHKEPTDTIRSKLFSYTALICAIFFGVIWFLQVLFNVTSDLKTMSRHANMAVDNLNAYEEQRRNLNEFLDSFYLAQGQLATAMIRLNQSENLPLDRETMQEYATALDVKYISLFDKNGKVVITNSPYDHMEVSSNPEDFSYQFRKVLEGVNHLVMEPMKDDWLDEYLQYVAVIMRDESGQGNGFVLIGVDPHLRDTLLTPLHVDSVLQNLVIGPPDEALAVDKETMTIVSTTGIGFIGSNIEELGLTEDMLLKNFSGFLNINGSDYYAGVSTSSQYYLVTLMNKPAGMESVSIALKLTLIILGAALLICLLTLFRYQKLVLDDAPKEEEGSDNQSGINGRLKKGLFGILHHFFNPLPPLEKKGIEDRWGMARPTNQLDPNNRIARYIYRLLLLFCVLILLPTLMETLNGRKDPDSLNGLAYVLSGNWQKGVNIFAFTNCILLLCCMYVVVVLVRQILYRIARISDMHVETICLLLKNAIKYVCVIIFVYYGLSQFGVQTQTLLASAGIMSLMISMGAKDLVSDVIAGFFTIIEGSFKVGDRVTIGGWSGTVVQIGLRSTKVRSMAETKVISNSAIREVINSDGDASSMTASASLNVPIAYEADLMEIEKILEEELPKLMDVIPGLTKEPTYDGVDSLGENCLYLRISITTKLESKSAALRSLTREIKLLFDRRGIEIPYNQLVLHNALGNAPEADKGPAASDSRPEKRR